MNQNLAIAGLSGIFLIVCVLLEAFLVWRFRIKRFAPALPQAALANVTSVAVLYFIWPLLSRMDIDEDKVFPLLPILMFTTILTEALLWKAFNRGLPWSRIFLATAVANIASFAVLYALLLLL